MNILTAINNEKIFRELKNKNKINIISNDIQYKEGIIEILEKNKNIDFAIINENISGQIKIEELIKKIKNASEKTNLKHFQIFLYAILLLLDILQMLLLILLLDYIYMLFLETHLILLS